MTDTDTDTGLADAIDRIEAKLDRLCAFAESVQTALARLEGHPMLGKLLGGSTAQQGNGDGY